jgi:DNA-binding CsgD family transcriptional regulator
MTKDNQSPFRSRIDNWLSLFFTFPLEPAHTPCVGSISVGTTRLTTLPGLDRIGEAGADGAAGTIGLIIGPGGTGKTRLLDDLAARGDDRGQSTLILAGSMAGTPLGIPDRVDADLLLIDDAHFLDADEATALLRVAEDRTRTFDLCVAMRPVHDHVLLGRLVEVAERRGALIELGSFTDDELAAALAEHLDDGVDASVFDAVRTLTHGQPLVVDRLVNGWMTAGLIARGRLVGDADPRPAALERALLGPVRQLSESARHVLGALARAAVEGTDGPTLLEHDLAELRAHGLLGPTGMAPAIAHTALGLLSPADLAAGDQLLAEGLARSGASAMEIAERFWATAGTGENATTAWIAAGDELLDQEPTAAAEWYARANQTDPSTDTLARRAVALAAAGDDAGANHAIADVLRHEPRNARTLGAGAQMAATQGRWAEAAELLEAIDHHPRWPLGLVDALNDATLLLAGRSPSTTAGAASADPTAALVQQSVDALRLSLEHIPDTTALTDAVRELATRVGAVTVGPDLPINPFELGAATALAAGELAMADLLLDAAGDTITGSAGAALHNWLAVRAGGTPQRTANTGSLTESPYVGLLDLAADAVDARRAGDVAASSAVLDKLRQVVALAPIDALTFDAANELLILATRFGSRTVADTLHERIQRFLSDAGAPPLWTARYLWSRVETAAAVRDLDMARTASGDLKELGPVGPRLDPLINAAATWVEILEEVAAVVDVKAAAAELQSNGYRWEAAHLVGQAAIRMQNAADAKDLLNHARELRGSTPSPAGSESSSPSGLSDREIEVAELILDGHSYKEIGARLFISAKTVEHHVSHIRRKLDATGVPRAAFLAALRSDLGR